MTALPATASLVLHLLTNRRAELVAVRTQTLNRLHRLLTDLVPGGAGTNLTAKRAAALLGSGHADRRTGGHALAARRRPDRGPSEVFQPRGSSPTLDD